MKQPTFFEGVAVALTASLLGSALYSVLSPVLPADVVLRLLIAGTGIAYVLYLLSRSHERVGRVTIVAAWSLVTGVIWFVAPPLLPYVLVQLGFIWLTRSLYFYSSVLPALADLGLHGLSLASAIWAAGQTGSVFLSLWCFFLVQALFVAIPTRLGHRDRGTPAGPENEDRFQRAHRTAEAAVRKLSSTH
jgi:hypothetical protein